MADLRTLYQGSSPGRYEAIGHFLHHFSSCIQIYKYKQSSTRMSTLIIDCIFQCNLYLLLGSLRDPHGHKQKTISEGRRDCNRKWGQMDGRGEGVPSVSCRNARCDIIIAEACYMQYATLYTNIAECHRTSHCEGQALRRHPSECPVCPFLCGGRRRHMCILFAGQLARPCGCTSEYYSHVE